MQLLLILPREIIYEILEYLNQFDLHNWLLVNRDCYNNPVLNAELSILRKWCDRRAPASYYLPRDKAYIDGRIYIDKNIKIDNNSIIFSKQYNKYIKYYIEFLVNLKENLYYYPGIIFYAHESNRIHSLRIKNLHVAVHIKIPNSNYLKVINDSSANKYHFALISK